MEFYCMGLISSPSYLSECLEAINSIFPFSDPSGPRVDVQFSEQVTHIGGKNKWWHKALHGIYPQFDMRFRILPQKDVENAFWILIHPCVPFKTIVESILPAAASAIIFPNNAYKQAEFQQTWQMLYQADIEKKLEPYHTEEPA